MDRSPHSVRWLCLWMPCYALLLGAVVWSMFAAHEWATAELATPQSVAEWEAWRADVRSQQEHPAPTQRRVPESAEPPALVLMRDHFSVLFAGAILFSTLLFWVIAWFVTGMLTAPPSSDRAHHGADRPGNSARTA